MRFEPLSPLLNHTRVEVGSDQADERTRLMHDRTLRLDLHGGPPLLITLAITLAISLAINLLIDLLINLHIDLLIDLLINLVSGSFVGSEDLELGECARADRVRADKRAHLPCDHLARHLARLAQ